MLSSISSAAVHRAAGLFTLLAAVAAPGTAAWAASPFQAFDGKWKGGGTVTADGNQERIRCTAHYKISGGGNALHINVNCASDSYRVTIVSSVVAKGSTFSGSWRETTRQLSGEVSGRIPETEHVPGEPTDDRGRPSDRRAEQRPTTGDRHHVAGQRYPGRQHHTRQKVTRPPSAAAAIILHRLRRGSSRVEEPDPARRIGP